MLKNIEIYQQPAGFSDSIIMSWMIERSSEEVPQAIHQRDLFAAALSEDAVKACFLSHQSQIWIAGKMTSVLQLTDTDMSYPLKAAAQRAKDRLKKEMRHAAMVSNEKPCFRCGPYEILLIAYEAHEHMRKTNLAEQTVLKGLRRNGMLSWRPNLSLGKLVKCSEQEWCKEMPEGSHRYPSEWLENRNAWLNEAGEPSEPVWSKSSVVKSVEDMTDASYHGEPGCKVQLECWKDSDLAQGQVEPFLEIECDQEAIDAEIAKQIVNESKKELMLIEVNKMLSGSRAKQNKSSKSSKHQKHKGKVREKAMMRKALKSWRHQQLDYIKSYSRRQLLQALIPEAGRSKQKTKKKLEGLTKAKSKASLKKCLLR
jgi:hypothetical protein